MNLILASASPRRKILLESLGIPFEIRTLPVQEKTDGPWFRIALDNAFLKADAVARIYPDSVVIGADTVIEFGSEVLGKPSSKADAFSMLSRFSGKTHQVVTGCAVLCLNRNIRIRFAEITRVHFRELSPQVIEEYLAAVPVLDKAGAYAIQDHGDLLADKVEGSLNNVIGLPVERLSFPLKKLFGH